MERKTVKDFHPEVMKLFDQFVHGDIDRRGFLNGAAKYAVGGTTAIGLLEALSPRFAEAQQIKKDDARIETKMCEFASPDGHVKANAYMAYPAKSSGKLPAVVVIHENRGLNPHIEDVTRRLAVDGYLAFAPDALFTYGGYPGDEDKARELFAKVDQPKARNDFIAAVKYLKTLSNVNGRVGAVGFCYGGGIANMLATKVPELNAAVPFYGPGPSAEDASRIRTPLLIQYAENDERINAGWPAYETALKAAGVKYAMHKYPGTQHGFNNDTTPRFDEAAAKLAWTRTLEFFAKHLKT